MRKVKYEKPLFRKMKKMNFVLRPISKAHRVVCRQCSSCHGCR